MGCREPCCDQQKHQQGGGTLERGSREEKKKKKLCFFFPDFIFFLSLGIFSFLFLRVNKKSCDSDPLSIKVSNETGGKERITLSNINFIIALLLVVVFSRSLSRTRARAHAPYAFLPPAFEAAAASATPGKR